MLPFCLSSSFIFSIIFCFCHFWFHSFFGSWFLHPFRAFLNLNNICCPFFCGARNKQPKKNAWFNFLFQHHVIRLSESIEICFSSKQFNLCFKWVTLGDIIDCLFWLVNYLIIKVNKLPSLMIIMFVLIKNADFMAKLASRNFPIKFYCFNWLIIKFD